jgi:hypothetical protein
VYAGGAGWVSCAGGGGTLYVTLCAGGGAGTEAEGRGTGVYAGGAGWVSAGGAGGAGWVSAGGADGLGLWIVLVTVMVSSQGLEEGVGVQTG